MSYYTNHYVNGTLAVMETEKKVLVVDDDPQINEVVSEVMQEEGWDVSITSNGIEALSVKKPFDLIILDLKLPGIDGFEVCRRIHEFSKIPIIILSGLKNLEDRERCLKLGADDYITKPFELDELRFRVRAISFRKKEYSRQNGFDFDDGYLRISFSRRFVAAGGQQLRLTPKEYALLHELEVNEGKPLSHQYLLTKLWGNGYSIDVDLLQVCVSRLRSKIEQDRSKPRYIVNQWQYGYVFGHGIK
jgi:two-component system KDP operon response regulator KdpE